MSRQASLAALLFTMLWLIGCQPSKPAVSPGPMSKQELEATVAKKLELKDVSLTDQGAGRFTGTGKTADGLVAELEVIQKEHQLNMKKKWKSADGSETTAEVNTSVSGPP